MTILKKILEVLSIIFFLAVFNCIDAQEVMRGPYLQVGTPTSIIIKWRTDVQSDSRVIYGSSPGNLIVNVEDSKQTTEHEVSISDLTPSTKYYYAIGTTSTVLAGDAPDYFFITSPPPGTHKPIRIWILGDSGTKDDKARAVRDAYYNFAGERYTDLWLMLGDNAYSSGSDNQYQDAVFENMYEAMLRKSVLWPTLGNHDDNTSSSPGPYPYYDIFTLPKNGEAGGMASGTEAYYSFDYGNLHFICLNSATSDLRSSSSAMWTWLEADLASTDKDWTFAFWHHPPYSKGSHDSDDESELIQMRERALPLLEDAGVDLVLCGHSHSYERSYLLDGHYGKSNTLTSDMILDSGDGREDSDGAYTKATLGPASHEGAVYIVAGSSGKTSGGSLDHPVMFTSINKLGSLVLDVDGSQLDARFIDNTGDVRDYFTMRKGSLTDVARSESEGLPTRFFLSPNYPNPFNPTTHIRFDLPEDSFLTLKIYNSLGREIKTLVNEHRPAGSYIIHWDGEDNFGAKVASGTYYVRLQAGEFLSVQKMAMVK